MANVLVEEQSLQDIADAIREVTSTEDKLKPREMGNAQRNFAKGLINQANATTGKEDTTLTSAVGSLVEGFGQGGSSGLPYDMGEFVLDADTTSAAPSGITHQLGVRPKFILIWTDDFADLSADNVSPYDTATCIGYIWLDGLAGMPQRLTSTATSDSGCFMAFNIAKGEYRISLYAPTSQSYMIDESYANYPTENKLFLVRQGSNYYWRAGVTYKYFVSENWWNIGGIVNAE